MVAWINRNLPVLVAISIVLMLVQLLQRHWPSGSGWRTTQSLIVNWIGAHAWYLLCISVLLWLVVYAVWKHDSDSAPHWIYWLMPMDVLDRLTKKREIEEAAEVLDNQAVFVDADSLSAALKSRIMGQDNVCDDIAQQIRRRMALSHRTKPIGVFLLAGPPGTGKTFLAKILAKELDRKLLHLDMTQYAAGSFAASQLFGSPKGYVGSSSYGQLTAGLRDFPNAIVLLDEIEKAHPDVLKTFLTAWNDGFITEASDGKQVSTTQCIFVLTSNAATDALASLAREYAKDADALRSASVAVLREHGFAPEVLNRIDRIFTFKPLGGLDIARVCALEIEAMIKGYGLDVVGGGIAPEIIIELMGRYKHAGTAASSRDLVRSIEESIADSLISAKQDGRTAIELHYIDGKVVANGASGGS